MSREKSNWAKDLGVCFREIVDEYMKHNSYSDKEDQPKLKVNMFGELVEKE